MVIRGCYLYASFLRFTQYAMEHPEQKFLVTPVGCGNAGYTPEEMAPILKDAAFLENEYLLISFRKVLMREYNIVSKNINQEV